MSPKKPLRDGPWPTVLLSPEKANGDSKAAVAAPCKPQGKFAVSPPGHHERWCAYRHSPKRTESPVWGIAPSRYQMREVREAVFSLWSCAVLMPAARRLQ